MNEHVEHDAREYGLHVKQGGWRLGLLVARSVVKGTPGGGGTDGSHRRTRDDEKVSASQFGKKAGTSADRVLRHLEAWQKAAEDGHVPEAATLGPGQEPRLKWDALPDWSDYYPPVTGGYNGGDERKPSSSAVKKVLEQASPEVIAKAVEQMDEGDRIKAVTSIREGNEMGGEQQKKTKRAIREEVQEDPDVAHYRLVRLAFARADDDLRDGAKWAHDTNFSAERKERLLQRWQITADVLDFLRMAIDGTENVDWDEELARLSEAAEATEGGS